MKKGQKKSRNVNDSFEINTLFEFDKRICKGKDFK